jgi:hypothetical protein
MILGYILHLKSPFLSMGFFICKNLDFSTTKLVPKREMSFRGGSANLNSGLSGIFA